MTGSWWKSVVSGSIKDELDNPVPFCSISLVLKDRDNEATTQEPYTTLSILTGEYTFSIDVSYNDNYKSEFYVVCNNFVKHHETIELTYSNSYKIEGKITQMER